MTFPGQRIAERLQRLYGPAAKAQELCARLQRLWDQLPPRPKPPGQRWSEDDVVLICYGDSVKRAGEPPLQTLRAFLDTWLRGGISAVHILPFFPYSSDDGFSVIDYEQVNPALGSWDDIDRLAANYDLAFDLVLNHVSRSSRWFTGYLNDTPPYNGYFLETDPAADLRQVVRPRTSPLLTEIHTPRGVKHLWTTFSSDQMDVNFHNPEVLLQYVAILLGYLAHGARLIRLDAVAFVWKEEGTDCLHRPQTHEIVKLLRDMLESVCPNGILITETNVPHRENLSYFGAGDEAHMVYQFALPPLLLQALYRGTVRHLASWLAALEPPPPGCTYLNFTASHDGIGLRPVEGILADEEIADLVDGMRRFGGYITQRTRSDGTTAPYELNIALFSAMKGTWRGEDSWQVERFLCGQTLMLGLQGMPALYIHSVVASCNDHQGVELSGRTRSINRHRWDADQLEALLKDEKTVNAQVLQGLRHRLWVRRRQPAFHPDAAQEVLEAGEAILAFRRVPAGGAAVLCLHNLTDQVARLEGRMLAELRLAAEQRDLLTGQRAPVVNGQLVLAPYQTLWLA